ncbi:MAG TPA: hypothetical protein VHR41_11990 [Gemmatimonadales bacterium]|jgi:hypothetical protein|nr:hypothetical protein [Gemmatimonadales bacterium]
MSTRLEIPFPPQRQPERTARVEPPFVPLDPRWEYKALVREAGEELPSETDLNALGADHWELTGVASLGYRVHFYFKRERRS